MEVRAGYKQTEVGVIPEDWDVQHLANVADVRGGIAKNSKVAVSDPVFVPYLRVANVQDGFLDLSEVSWIELSRQDLMRYSVVPGDVLMNEGGDLDKLGRGAIWKGEFSPCVHQNHVFVVRCKPHLLPEYLDVWTGTKPARKFFLLAGKQTTNLASISKSSLGELPVAVPPLAEQRVIAATLSDVDALLGGLDRLSAKKRDLKQAAMQQLLTGKTRLPGFQGAWNSKRLGQLAKIQRGASPRPIDSPVWFDENSSIGWVRISDVTSSGMFLHTTTQQLSLLGVKSSRPVAAGSLIMSICATVGRPVITKIDTCIHDGFVVFDDLEADQLFIYYVLKWIEPDWSKHGQTGSQMNLNTGLINGTRIELPPRDEQKAIASALSDMDAELSALEARRDKTRALKQGMMQELLTGKTRLGPAGASLA
jgi:type I restriction enzyme, S subunit